MKVLEKDFRRIEESHGRNTLKLGLPAGFIRKLLGSAPILKFMSRKYADVLGEFEKLAEAGDLSDSSELPSRRGLGTGNEAQVIIVYILLVSTSRMLPISRNCLYGGHLRRSAPA